MELLPKAAIEKFDGLPETAIVWVQLLPTVPAQLTQPYVSLTRTSLLINIAVRPLAAGCSGTPAVSTAGRRFDVVPIITSTTLGHAGDGPDCVAAA